MHRCPIHPLRLIDGHRLGHDGLLSFNIPSPNASSIRLDVRVVRGSFRFSFGEAAYDAHDGGDAARVFEDTPLVGALSSYVEVLSGWESVVSLKHGWGMKRTRRGWSEVTFVVVVGIGDGEADGPDGHYRGDECFKCHGD